MKNARKTRVDREREQSMRIRCLGHQQTPMKQGRRHFVREMDAQQNHASRIQAGLRRRGARIHAGWRISVGDRLMASMGGLIVATLSLSPVVLIVACNGVDGFASWKSFFVCLALCSPFLAVAAFGVVSIVRSNKSLVKMQSFLDSLSAAERAEFDRMIATHEDVEVVIDEDRERHFEPLDS